LKGGQAAYDRADQTLESSDILNDSHKMENDRQYVTNLPIFLSNRHTNN